MQKLITKYLAKPTLANAMKVSIYNRLHPMAACMLTIEENATLNEILAKVARCNIEVI